MRKILLLQFAVLLASCSRSNHHASSAPANFDHHFSAWGRVLARCETNEGFRYALIEKDRSDLDQALEQLSSVSPESFKSFTRDQRLAFLINAHNAFAVRRVIKRARVLPASGLRLRDIHLLGRAWSLVSLREEIMGTHYSDCRALFALNWGMKGCMSLPPGPAKSNGLQDLLEEQTRRFVRDPRFCTYKSDERLIRCSELIRDYQRPIERDFTTLWGFFKHYVTPADLKNIELAEPRIRFSSFDTSLNDAPAP